MSSFTVTDHTEQAIAAMRAGSALAIRAATKEAKDGYAGWVAIKTGFTKASAYTVTSDASTYSQAVGRAQNIDPFRPVLDEVEHPTSELEGIVAVAAASAFYLENGTSRMGAQPAMAPALAAVRAHLPELLEKFMAQALKAVAIGES